MGKDWITRHWVSLAVLSAVAIAVFMLTYDQLWILDEKSYMYNFADQTPIQSISDIFQSQCSHYVGTNGRFVAHFLVQIFLVFVGKIGFAVCNALMTVAVVVLMLRLVKSRLRTAAVITSSLLVLLMCDTEYVPTTQISFVWMQVLVLGFFCLFFNYATERQHVKWYICVLCLVYAIICGDTHDVYVVGISASLGIFFLLNYRRFSPLQWVLFVGFALGAAFLVLAPNNFKRADNLHVPVFYSILNAVSGFRVVYILVCMLIYKMIRKQVSLKAFYKANYFYINAMLIVLIMDLYLGVYIRRQLFGVEFFATILCLKLAKDHSFKKVYLAVFAALIVVVYVMKYVQIRRSLDAYDRLVAEMRASGSDPIYIDLPQYHLAISPVSTIRFGILEGVLISAYKDVYGDDKNGFDMPKAYPTQFRELQKQKGLNTAVEYLPGEYLLMQDKTDPKQFFVRRNIDLGLFSIPLPEKEINIDKDCYLNTPDYNVMYIYQLLPVLKNEEIIIR